MQLKDIMTKDVKLGDPSMVIQEAAQLMRDGDFGVLPIGENDRLIGVITDRDITVRCCAEGKDPTTATLREVMSEGVRWAYEDASIKEVSQLMRKHRIRRLPLINHDRRLVGIVSLGDLAVEESGIQPAAETLSGVSAGAEQHHRH